MILFQNDYQKYLKRQDTEKCMGTVKDKNHWENIKEDCKQCIYTCI